MRIALIGYGKMGKLIDKLAIQKGHEVMFRIQSHNSSDISKIQNVDVAIEFTEPGAAISNFKKLVRQNIPIVTGTTGWLDEFKVVEKLISTAGGKFFYASNFSIGVHISIAVSKYLSRIIQDFPDYKAFIEEWHHTEKKDAPSGTAISFANEIIKNHKAYTKIADQHPDYKENELPIYAYRENEIPGTHQITFESEIDSIILCHKAKNRLGFATGALKAAEFLIEQKPGIYNMNHLIKLPL